MCDYSRTLSESGWLDVNLGCDYAECLDFKLVEVCAQKGARMG